MLTDAKVKSLLYDEPRLYDLVFPDADDTLGVMCRSAFERYLSAPPVSVLDVGCGTGRLLDSLSKTIAECWGVDYMETNIAYAQAARPQLVVQQGDMRAVRLGRTFDVVTCFGNVLSYALTNDDLVRTVETFAAHANAGSLLIVDVLNALARQFVGALEGNPAFVFVRVDALEVRIAPRGLGWHVSPCRLGRRFLRAGRRGLAGRRDRDE